MLSKSAFTMCLATVPLTWSCKTTDDVNSNLSNASLKNLNRFECVDHLRPFSQGRATIYEWPTSFRETQGDENPYTYAIIVHGKEDSAIDLYLEDSNGGVYQGISAGRLENFRCQEFDDMGCVTFRLPIAESPTLATRFQLFDDESLITIHDIVTNESSEFKQYTAIDFSPVSETASTVLDDISLRLGRMDETVGILIMNQNESYASDIKQESEKVKTACAQFAKAGS